jgi:leucyl/phenylalanyl-tRNA--protein transferase
LDRGRANLSERPVPPFPPIEPPVSRAHFPDPRRVGRAEVLGVGADFSPGTLLKAYRSGIFPWPQSEDIVPWVSPSVRAVRPLHEDPHWSRSLRRVLRKHPFTVTVDRAFEQVMRACGDDRRDEDGAGTWIVPEMVAGYVALHHLGWTHSVEVWDGELLVGGIYGIAVGAMFAGESMFHRRTDASKIAFATLVDRLRSGGFLLFDVQVLTPHLASLGCVSLPRRAFLDALADAVGRSARIS